MKRPKHVLLGALFGVAALVNCGLFGAVEPAAVDCATRVLDDAAKNMTVAQIIEDVSGPCGMDAAAVIAILLKNQEKVHDTKAYAEATRVKAVVVQP